MHVSREAKWAYVSFRCSNKPAGNQLQILIAAVTLQVSAKLMEKPRPQILPDQVNGEQLYWYRIRQLPAGSRLSGERSSITRLYSAVYIVCMTSVKDRSPTDRLLFLVDRPCANTKVRLRSNHVSKQRSREREEREREVKRGSAEETGEFTFLNSGGSFQFSLGLSPECGLSLAITADSSSQVIGRLP